MNHNITRKSCSRQTKHNKNKYTVSKKWKKLNVGLIFEQDDLQYNLSKVDT